MHPAVRSAMVGAGLIGALVVGGATASFAASSADSATTQSDTSTSDQTTTDQARPDQVPDQHPPDGAGRPGQRPDVDPSKGGHTANGRTEELLTGDTATKVTEAALAAVPGATVERVETDADGAVYEAHLVTSDGQHQTVTFDADYNLVEIQDGGPGGGPGGMGGGMGGGHGRRGGAPGQEQDGTAPPASADGNGTTGTTAGS
ncbi:MAG: hypothetical protein R2761_02685 [Acidimicrobiales bacterium]